MTFGLRPEHIGPSDRDGVRVPAKVLLVEPLGAETLGLLKLGDAADGPELTGRFAPDTKLGVGDDISVSLALDYFHLFEPETGAAIRGAGE